VPGIIGSRRLIGESIPNGFSNKTNWKIQKKSVEFVVKRFEQHEIMQSRLESRLIISKKKVSIL
jgi:predicted XRE-type DNA-binding protein